MTEQESTPRTRLGEFESRGVIRIRKWHEKDGTFCMAPQFHPESTIEDVREAQRLFYETMDELDKENSYDNEAVDFDSFAQALANRSR